MSNKMVIAAIDVGNFDNLGMWIFHGMKDYTTAENKKSFFEDFLEEVGKNGKGAIGFEAPLFIPSGDIGTLIGARTGIYEHKKHNIDCICGASLPWSGQNSPVPYAIPLLDIFFQAAAASDKKFTIFTDYDEFAKFRDAQLGILVYEAFISGGLRKIKKCKNHYKKIQETIREYENQGEVSKEWNKKTEAKKYYEAYYNPKEYPSHDHDAMHAGELFTKFTKDEMTGKIHEVETSPPYINLPKLLAESRGCNFQGSDKRGLIVRSPKPCFEDIVEANSDIIKLSWEKKQ